MTESAQLFHPETFGRTPYFGQIMHERMLDAAEYSRARHEVYNGNDPAAEPELTVLIRTKNDAGTIEQLFDELGRQAYGHEPQVVVVDTESSDGTPDIARSYGATVLSIAQRDFNYPRALNIGFRAAETPTVYSLVGHSNLASNMTLRSAGHWMNLGVGGAYGVSLPNYNATWTERLGAVQLGLPNLLRPATPETTDQLGMLATNCAAISVEAWRELGGFSEQFASGGEDGDMARRMLAAGIEIVRDPSLSVHHTHGLGPINGLKQLMHWRGFKNGAPFDEQALLSFRPDLRDKLN